MAYVPGTYSQASKASADEAARYREFLGDVDAMSQRERDAILRQQQAGLDTLAAGLTPKSNVAFPDTVMPAAPPVPGVNSFNSTATAGSAGTPNYEIRRLVQERKLAENQYNAEVSAFKTEVDTLGKQKYILEQQLQAAPPNLANSIREKIFSIDQAINTRMTGARDRVNAYNTFFKNIDTEIRTGQYRLGGGSTGSAVGLNPPGTIPARTETPAIPQTTAEVPQPSSIGMLPEARSAKMSPGQKEAAGYTPVVGGVTAPPGTTSGLTQAFPPGAKGSAAAATARPVEERYSRAAIDLGLAGYWDRAARDDAFNRGVKAVEGTMTSRGYKMYTTFFGTADELSTQSSDDRFLKGMTKWFNDNKTAITNSSQSSAEMVSNPLEFYKKYAGVTDVPANVEAQFNAAAAPSAAPAAAAPAAVAPTAAPGKSDAAGVALPTTVQNAAAATPALPINEDVSLGDTPRAQEIMRFSSAVVTKRAPELIANISSAVSSEEGQRIINRAKELGVDPAAAIAIYGVESSFGAQGGASGAGAVGPMQVTPAQYDNIVKFFTNKQFIDEYGVTPELTAAADALLGPNDPDAGLLQLKMAELIGLDKSLWGAGYQGNMWAVNKSGRPLATHDAGNGTQGMSNSDYNKLFATLYNEVRGYVNVAATSDKRGTGSTFELEQLDSAQSVVESNYDYTVKSAKTKYDSLVEQRDIAMKNLERAKQFSQYDDIQKYADEVAAIDKGVTDINDSLFAAETNARMAVDDLNMKRTKSYITAATYALEAGRPEAFADIYSRGTGMALEIDKMEDGKTYAVRENGLLVSGKGVTADQIKKAYLPRISESFAAQEAALQEQTRKMEGDIWLKKLEIQGNMSIEAIKSSAKMQEMLADGTLTFVKEIVDDTGATTALILADKQRNVLEMRPGTATLNSGGVTVTGPPTITVVRAGLAQ